MGEAEGKSPRKAGGKAKSLPTVLLPGPAPEKVKMSFKYRIYPTPAQEEYFFLNIAAVRVVYNHFLEERKAAWEKTRPTVSRHVVERGADGLPLLDEQGREVWARDDEGCFLCEEVENPAFDPDAKPMSFYDTSAALTVFKKQHLNSAGEPWLSKADSTALVYSLRNLDAAYQLFFGGVKRGEKVGYPRFKKRSGTGSFKVQAAGCKFGDDWIKIPKCDPVRAVVHRTLAGRPVSVTIRRDPAGRWFASINVDGAPAPAAPEPTAGPVALTMGIERWAVDSDGEVYDRSHADRREHLEHRLACLQRQLAAKQGAKKGEQKSNRYKRKQMQVARIQAKLADMRADDTHKLTRELVNAHGEVYARRMGTRDSAAIGKLAASPGKVQRAVNKGNRDSNYFEVNRQLAYKCEWAGRGFVELPERTPTAQTCSRCGHVEKTVAEIFDQEWTCPECGCVHDRKANGALNVLAAGSAAMEEAREGREDLVKIKAPASLAQAKEPAKRKKKDADGKKE